MTSDSDAQRWLPLSEAAECLGLSRHQLRRRIRAGRIASRRVDTQHGPAYEVRVDGDATVASAARHPDARNGGATVTVTPPLTELVNLLRETQRQNVELAGMVGSLQQRLVFAADRIRALEAPTADPLNDAHRDPPANGAAETPNRTWWRFWSR